MKVGARLKTIAELLEAIFQKDEPVDRFLSIYFKKNRFIGSKDRRFISQGVYGCLREKIFLEKQVASFPGQRKASEKLILLYCCQNLMSLKEVEKACEGTRYQVASLDGEEITYLENLPKGSEKKGLTIPSSLMGSLKQAFGENDLVDREMYALMEKGSVDIRVNTLKTNRESIQNALKKKGIVSYYTPFSPVGLRLENATPLRNLDIFKEGLIELQDEGSQLTTFLLGVSSGHNVLDYCAGAGGKTLALSALMKNKGAIVATDICAHRLQKSLPRLRRAGCINVKVDSAFLEKSSYKKEEFDRVFVDAPCSGSGTWRRHPEDLARTSLETIRLFHSQQKKILKAASAYVKKGGFLLYVTCSIFKEENEGVIEDFIAKNGKWQWEPITKFYTQLPPVSLSNPLCLRLSPYKTQTDGFFAALLKRKE